MPQPSSGKNGDKQNPSASPLARIRSQLPTFATSEQKVGQWVGQHAQDLIHMSMAQVGRECGVSDTTVLRFCRAAGFRGFTDMKLAIIQDMASPTQLVHDDISEQDDVITIVRKVFMSNMQALQDTMDVLNEDAVVKAVNLLRKANQILIIGVGTSGPIVNDMHHMFFRLGLNVRAQTDSYLQLAEAALVGPSDVVVGISQSGSSIDPVLTMAEAKRNGARTICITGNAQSPITEYADITLITVSRESRAETIASRIVQSTLMDALYVAISFFDVDATIQKENRIWEAVLAKTI